MGIAKKSAILSLKDNFIPLSKDKYWSNLSGMIVAVYSRKKIIHVCYISECNKSNISSLIQSIKEELEAIEFSELKCMCPENLLTEFNTFLKMSSFNAKIFPYKENSGVELIFDSSKKVLKLANNPMTPVQVVPRVNKKIRVLVVDDSKLIRKILVDALNSDDKFEVISETGNPEDVKSLVKKYNPDVMTLDINMPKMDGVEVIQDLGGQLVPTIIVSSINISEGTKVIEALTLGAVDYIQKPELKEIESFKDELFSKIQIASGQGSSSCKGALPQRTRRKNLLINEKSLIAIGSSTGGVQAIKAIFSELPEHIPPIVIVQHIPEFFSKAFADSLDKLCPFLVKEAKDGDVLRPNTAYLAPGGKQMKVLKSGNEFFLNIEEGKKVSGHAPSVDFLFNSIAELKLKNVLGIILTGMGSDGAKGLKKIRDLGNETIAQDENSCVVFGMPRRAIDCGAAKKVTPLEKIADEICTYITKK